MQLDFGNDKALIHAEKLIYLPGDIPQGNLEPILLDDRPLAKAIEYFFGISCGNLVLVLGAVRCCVRRNACGDYREQTAFQNDLRGARR